MRKKFILVARDSNNGIGKDGTLPWHHPEDLKMFRKLTWGKSVLMGRKTWESIPGNLSGRFIHVLTRNKNYLNNKGRFINVINDIKEIDPAEPLVILGGGEIYDLVLKKYSDNLEVVICDVGDSGVVCDTHFHLGEEWVNFANHPIGGGLIYRRFKKWL